MKFGIFTGFSRNHHYYISACEELGIDYELIDIIADDWIEILKNSNCDIYFCRPPSKFQERKSMYDERLYFATRYLNKRIYPTYDELFIYENKKMMQYLMRLYDYPHLRTMIFYRKIEFMQFIEETKYPFVFKTNIGSSSQGVEIVKGKNRAKSIAHQVFGRVNEKLAPGFTPQKTGKIIGVQAKGCLQRHFVIAQEFLDFVWEWRIIRIGNSYFGQRKLVKDGFASGSKLKGWGAPPLELLHLVKRMAEENHFHSLAVDIFESKSGAFYINEIQSIFGSTGDSQMYVDDRPGRYVFTEGEFVFEEGVFNQHCSYLLRVKHAVELLEAEGRGRGA